MRTNTRPAARDRVHVRPAADATSWDLRRVLAAALSGILPGLGQAYNRRRRLALWLLIPSLALIGLVLIVVEVFSPTRLLAWSIAPGTLRMLLVLNALVLGWRLIAVVQAFFDRRFVGAPGRAGVVGLAVIVALVIAPHALITSYGVTAMDSFSRIFQGEAPAPGETAAPEPTLRGRLTILLVGVDSAPWRTTTLTDTLIVASIDPIGKTATMMSIPRDLVDTPLGDGNTFGPKINSLLSYADRHSAEFPEGGTKTLQHAVSTLLGIDIDYTATIDFVGFKKMVDILGGVTIVNEKPIDDRNYNSYEGRGQGFRLSKGTHTLDGIDALAYVRSRFTPGDTDFDRAARQQQVLLALRDQFISHGGLLEVPALLEALGDSVRTDLPTSLLPDLAALSEEIGANDIVRIVMRSPMLHSGGKNNPYGSVQVPDVALIREVAAAAFGAPGAPPQPWPTPKPTAAPVPSASP
jgi:LCP family protein required for cell wall assembly